MIDIISEGNVENISHVEARLKVIGVGGAGGNAINSMIESKDCGSVQFIAANTDAQALGNSLAECKIQLGSKITKGLGAGSNPDIGRRAAEEDIEAIKERIAGTEILFLAAGLGGGTGSGAMPIIARAAREMGILTIAVVTKPFAFEGKRRANHAEKAIENLSQSSDTMIIVPNERLLEIAGPNISMLDAFALSNGILQHAVKGISDIIQRPGMINVDFADVRSVMEEMGMAIMGTGRCSGEGRAKKAALQAINSPLLENISINGANGILLNITGNTDLTLQEVNDAASVIYDLVNDDANIILGSVIDQDMGDEIMITVIATGLSGTQRETIVVAPVNETIQPAQKVGDISEGNGETDNNKHQPATLQCSKIPTIESQDQFDTHSLESLETPACMRREGTQPEDEVHQEECHQD